MAIANAECLGQKQQVIIDGALWFGGVGLEANRHRVLRGKAGRVRLESEPPRSSILNSDLGAAW